MDIQGDSKEFLPILNLALNPRPGNFPNLEKNLIANLLPEDTSSRRGFLSVKLEEFATREYLVFSKSSLLLYVDLFEKTKLT